MGIGRLLLSKTLRVVLPFAGVVVPVAVLFQHFLIVVDASYYNVDLFGVIVGAMVFSASIIYLGVKQEKAVEKEDDWNDRRRGK